MPETPTLRLGLYRPKSDGSENVNVLTDLNNNLDKIDSYMGFQSQPTQAARLAVTGAYVGMAVRQSDTGVLYVLTALPASTAGNWAQVVVSPMTSPLDSTGTTTAGTAFTTAVAGEANKRLIVGADGRLTWGNGTAVGDTNLYRAGVDVLKTDDTFSAAALVTSGVNLDLGVWSTWNPTLGGGLAPGNGTTKARWMYRNRHEVACNYQLTCGSSSAKGTSSGWSFSLPVAPAQRTETGSFWINDSGAMLRVGSCIINAGSVVELYLPSSGGPLVGNSLTGTFATSAIQWSISYEV